MMPAMLAAPLAQPWMNASDPPEARAAKLVAATTLAEKIALFHGSWKGHGQRGANTRLGIPAIKMNDGPQGFATMHPALRLHGLRHRHRATFDRRRRWRGAPNGR